ncbi:MAG: hypothetical protein KIT25_03860 [Enhydrobacter sp.]|nr:MAG: hypothetical protein KIT25_03860 [Enhydrobacter sp.]
MIERLTYLCGIAVAVISWAIGQLVADLTAVPVVYTATEAVSAPPGTKFEMRNLSRSKRIGELTINFLAPTGCVTQARPGGTEWTLEAPSELTGVTVGSLMPGSVFFVNVTHAGSCKVRFGIGFKENTPVRVIGGGIESFLLFNWLTLIVALVLGAAVVFGLALAKAYQLSRPTAPAK